MRKMTKPNDCGEQGRKTVFRGKSGLHRARITANGRRGRPQGKCNRDIPPMKVGKGGKAR